jgi:nucleotide-binding universal stress UspA family protein
MRKILVPIDSSDNAMRALCHAIQLVKQDPWRNCISPMRTSLQSNTRGIAASVTEKRLRELQRLHSEDLLKPAREAAKAAGVNFTTEIVIGDVASAIARYAEEKGCDAIVMGTRGMGSIGNLLMGSVATKVIHLTKLPVTLVK